MGACCSGDTNVENAIIAQMELMKIRSLLMAEVKSVLYANLTSVNGFELNKLSVESLNLYKRTLKTISYDSFITLASDNLCDTYNLFQSSYFKLLHQSSKSRRSIVFLYLIPIAKDTDDEKMKHFIDSFFSLNDQSKLNYADIKELITDYIKNTLVFPLISIKNTFEDINTKDSVDYVIKQTYNEKNTIAFVEYLFESFDRKLLNENDDDENSQLLSLSEDNFKEIIENYKYFLFDYQLLKDEFNQKISKF